MKRTDRTVSSRWELAVAPACQPGEGGDDPPGGGRPPVAGAGGRGGGGGGGRELPPGTLFGRYLIERTIGIGRSGEVYQAVEQATRRRVALRILRPDAPRPAGTPEALRAEAEATARLCHHAIPALLDAGRWDDRFFLATELVHGETLEARLARGPLPRAEAERLLREVAGALAAAHRRGVLHRLLWPRTVLLERDGAVRVLDFGVALITGPDWRAAVPAPYLATECLSGAEPDTRADVYAWGALGVGLLCDRRLGDAEVEAPGDDPLAALVGAAFAVDPEARPRDGAALVKELARQDDRLARWWPWAARRLARWRGRPPSTDQAGSAAPGFSKR